MQIAVPVGPPISHRLLREFEGVSVALGVRITVGDRKQLVAEAAVELGETVGHYCYGVHYPLA
jgi:hypothetical protein